MRFRAQEFRAFGVSGLGFRVQEFRVFGAGDLGLKGWFLGSGSGVLGFCG